MKCLPLSPRSVSLHPREALRVGFSVGITVGLAFASVVIGAAWLIVRNGICG